MTDLWLLTGGNQLKPLSQRFSHNDRQSVDVAQQYVERKRKFLHIRLDPNGSATVEYRDSNVENRVFVQRIVDDHKHSEYR